MCCKCKMWMGVVVFVVGIIFLLADLGVWKFWGINWWSVAFLLFGIKMFTKGCCKCTCAVEESKPKKK